MSIESQARARRVADPLPHEPAFDLESTANGALASSALERFAPSIARETIRQLRLRYRPGRSCTVLLEAGGEDERATFFLKVLSPGELASARKKLDEVEWEPGAHLRRPGVHESASALLFEFPQDVALPALSAWVLENHVLSSPDHDFELLRYKPESRAIFRVRRPAFGGAETATQHVVRMLAKRRFHSSLLLQKHADRLLDGHPRLRTAAVSQSFEDSCCTIHPWLEGVRLSSLLRSGDAIRAIHAAADALADFHAVSPRGIPICTLEEICAPVRRDLRALDTYPGTLRSTAGRLADAIERAALRISDCRFGVVHGDFHQGQILLQDASTALLDFDRMHGGDQDEDLGEFIAQMRTRALRKGDQGLSAAAEEFADRYGAHGGQMADPERVRFWTIVGLAKAALKEMRGLRPNWMAVAHALMADALAIRGG